MTIPIIYSYYFWSQVYQLGQCPLCSEHIAQKNSDPRAAAYYDAKALFLDHVHRVASYVVKEKKRIPIIWDDMLRFVCSISFSGVLLSCR